MRDIKISVIINTKNEELFIEDCLKSVLWASEIILIDGGSTDKTLEIVKKYKVKIVNQRKKEIDFAAWRNQGMEEAKGKWLLWVDADERITPPLEEEIKQAIESSRYAVYAIPRRNFLLGKELRHGGWYPDCQIRLFKRENLKGWVGKLHEHPEFKGELGKLKNPMIHLQPEEIEPALEKSIKWSGIEAELLFKEDHPRISWWRVLRMGGTILFERLFRKQGFRDGVEGWIESIYQSFHTMIIYMRLWEIQNQK